MINKIISFSIHNKFIIGMLTLALIGSGLYAMTRVPLGSVPDITSNQIQVITVSQNLATTDVEQFITYPVELAMANLPGIEEIRSISRFGLSVVTLVFKDDMGTYLPRQLVNEKLSEIKENIPEEFGAPFMGPISTGLGEIYQYYLAVDPEYDSVYNDRKLRTIQDWIVKRQMALVPGVAEVNSFGGHIKQYEITLNPDRLRSMNVTIKEIYQAIENNNGNTGGAYIEKNHKANFIRGEGLAGSLEDLNNIVIKTVNGFPLLIRDVAQVQYGQAVRYGAFTRDGEGEAVGGIIMMLKGANPNQVIQRVKERMVQIEKSLPPGVKIAPFLDRSELIGRTTFTISKNLIVGALIVIFVLVLLLGNLRGGLIVASVIPLSLLFAFLMMYLFDVSANLMSLGAIDFGILVDGAIIIVEAVVHLVDKHVSKHSGKHLSIPEMNQITYQSGSKMMNAAFFGQLIILIVFLPILTLTGIEGKMFRPMALTFGFAVLGAMILCLTYVPMISALFLRRKSKRGSKNRNFVGNLSHSIIAKIEKVYSPVIHWALRRSRWVLLIAAIFFGLALFTFTRLGAVFIPSLNEGDIVAQALLKPGTALDETIKASTKIEKILKENFPEVRQVVSRIGVSEIPTDPMPMDIADVIVLMKPEKEWTSANTKAALLKKFQQKLAVLPGINFQFSQPIEIRFNELLTGVREDVAIKIYGEDLTILANKAQELADIIREIKGVDDLTIEATQGLPQMTIQYKREKLAQYGLNIKSLNTIIRTAFAGKKAGVAFEGEKRFDIVVRLDSSYRQNMEDIRNLQVITPSGSRIPLQEVAEISYRSGPMQISRDGTKRRVYVGVNVRDRDIELLMNEIRQKLDKQLELPPGYHVTYGGAFENLQRASRRLAIVVPIALALIFLLLYLALKSLKQSAMIYMAIPLAAIGGVFSLYFRGLPFSISAGIGFIVLFGVAVLNGLVLISSLNELKEQGVISIKERICRGTKQRLRPILLTATAAIMGFMPMAFSTSAGSEVQRPLATVVIGGLITATLLTLIVIPVLYYLLEKKSNKRISPGGKTPGMISSLLLILLITGLNLSPKNVLAQQPVATSDTEVISSLSKAEAIALQNNRSLQIAGSAVRKRRQLQKTALNLPKTSFYYGKEEVGNDLPGISSIGFNQTFAFPSVYSKRASFLKEQTQLAQTSQAITQQQLLREVRLAWYHLQNAYMRLKVYTKLDSFYTRFYEAALLRYKTGETNKLEKMAAKGQQATIRLKKEQSKADIALGLQELEVLLNTGKTFSVLPSEEAKASLPPAFADTNRLIKMSLLQYYEQKIAVAKSQESLNKTKRLPSFNAGYAIQKVNGHTGFHSFQAGINLPLWFLPQQGRIEAAKTEIKIRKDQYELRKMEVIGQFKQFMIKYKQIHASLYYFENEGLQLADEILRNGNINFRQGEISYVTYIQNMNRTIALQENYLSYLNQYNEVITEINYLLNK